MRITTSMVQRNVLADLNTLQSSLAKTQSKAASQKEITRPSDDPYMAAQAMGLRSSIGANEQFVRNIQDAQGWMDSTEASLDSITQYVNRAHDLLVQGATDTADPSARIAIAKELDQIIQGVKETANASYGDKYIMSGTRTSTPPYLLGDDDTYQGDSGGLDPATPGIVREIGPGVTMSINAVAVELLGSGRTEPGDGKLLNALRDISDHLKANDGVALRDADMATFKTHLNSLLEIRARNGAQSNRLEAAQTRIDQITGALTERLSNTEDADFAKTLIQFNSQSAAYQAALKAGANIVQSSLMDFLR
jgi:flagellar hook-associated protein 3 FlgL